MHIIVIHDLGFGGLGLGGLSVLCVGPILDKHKTMEHLNQSEKTLLNKLEKLLNKLARSF